MSNSEYEQQIAARVIQPTVGRVVLYWPPFSRSKDDPSHPDPQPRAATIAYVWGDRLINIGFLDQNGRHHSATSVTLIQDGDEVPPFGASYCEWMPYQKGQAAKTEALEKVIEATTSVSDLTCPASPPS